MDEPAEKGAGGENDRLRAEMTAVLAHDAAHLPSLMTRLATPVSITCKFVCITDRLLHGLAIELAIGLGAGPRTAGPFDRFSSRNWMPRLIGDAAHEAVERIDLAHQMPLAESADGRIAGHLADRREAMRDQRGRAPSRAAAAAASHPAWPPPTTMTSKSWFMRRSILNPRTDVKTPNSTLYHRFHVKQVKRLFTDAEIAKDRIENLFDIDAPGQAAKIVGGSPQALSHEFQVLGRKRGSPRKIFNA